MKNRIVIGYSSHRPETYLKEFNKHLKNTVGCDHEIIPVVNTEGTSLTVVYNDIFAKTLPDDILVLCHHDIKFKSKGWGKNLLNIFNNNEVDIIGLAGTSKLRPHFVWWLDEYQQFDNRFLWGKVWHTDGTKEWKTDFTTPNRKCEKVQYVDVVDGVFIALNPVTCSPFDEDFQGFHFYDISFCCRNKLAGRKIAVTETIQLVHESGGQMDQMWEENRKLMMYKYSAMHTH